MQMYAISPRPLQRKLERIKAITGDDLAAVGVGKHSIQLRSCLCGGCKCDNPRAKVLKAFVPDECLFGCVAWILLQQDCNTTVRTATQPRNAVICRNLLKHHSQCKVRSNQIWPAFCIVNFFWAFILIFTESPSSLLATCENPHTLRLAWKSQVTLALQPVLSKSEIWPTFDLQHGLILVNID